MRASLAPARFNPRYGVRVNIVAHTAAALTVGVLLITGCASQPSMVVPTTPTAEAETSSPPAPSPSPERTLKEGFTIRGPVFVLFAPTGWSGDEIVATEGSVWRSKIERDGASLTMTVSRDQSRTDDSARSWIGKELTCESPAPIKGVAVAGNRASAAECVGKKRTTRGYAFVSGGRLFTLRFKYDGPVDEQEVDWILERIRLS